VQNAHRRGGGSVKVTLADGVTELRGTVTHADAVADVAIVRVRASGPLATVKLGTSANLRPGEFVVALGAPAGLSNSVSAGIVSAVQRTRSEIGLREPRSSRVTTEYIQTDAAINSGNSGGPLLNLEGEVIGINTMKVAGMDGIAFAVPIDDVKRVVNMLQTHGHVLRPYVGLKFVELDPTIATQLRARASSSSYPGSVQGGAPPDSGLYVMHVLPDSPAQRAGLRVGDTIVGIGGHSLRTTKELLDGLADQVGRRVTVQLQRDGRQVDAAVDVESMQQ